MKMRMLLLFCNWSIIIGAVPNTIFQNTKNEAFDVVIVFDQSRFMTNQFYPSIYSLVDLETFLTIGQNRTRIGIVSYDSTDVQIHATINEIDTVKDLNTKLDIIVFRKTDNSEPSIGLETAMYMLLDNETRREVPKAIILFAGDIGHYYNTKIISEFLAEEAISLIIVACGGVKFPPSIATEGYNLLATDVNHMKIVAQFFQYEYDVLCRGYCINGGKCKVVREMPTCECVKCYSGMRCETSQNLCASYALVCHAEGKICVNNGCDTPFCR